MTNLKKLPNAIKFALFASAASLATGNAFAQEAASSDSEAKTLDRIEVTACTQAPYMDLEETARVLGVVHSRVRIRPTACGGGFGGKLDVSV